MTVPGNVNELLLRTAAAAGGYSIDRSLRFNSADSAYLSRTPASAGNRKTWTWSGWLKGMPGTRLFSAGTEGTNDSGFGFQPYTFDCFNRTSSTINCRLISTAVYRDPSAWFHVVFVWNTTAATASDRVQIWVNGSRLTSFSTETYPAQNTDSHINNNVAQYLGRQGGEYFDGYLADIYFIDGTALTPSSFGETDATTGVWVPKTPTGLTYGTNGFHLDFADNSNNTASTLGKDTSGNGNNWTPNNLSVTAGSGNDSLRDSPTNGTASTGGDAGGVTVGNYCTLNPLVGTGTKANGNLEVTGTGCFSTATIAPPSGKWYWEITAGTISGDVWIGIYGNPNSITSYVVWGTGGTVSSAGGTASFSSNTITAGDVIGLAWDMGASTLQIYRNGSSVGSWSGFTLTGSWAPGMHLFSGTATAPYVFNFGQRAFAYAAPSGFKGLCTANLPAPTIVKPSTVMDVVLYTGTGSALTPTSTLGFNPDLVWIKGRSGATDHALYDAVRGVEKRLESNNTDAEVTSDGGVTAFNSAGFSVGTLAQVNTSSATYASWLWDAGTSNATNTSGTITSTVRANISAGFSVVTASVASSASGPTIGHGLGVTPKFIIGKNRSASIPWYVWHSSLSANQYLQLNSTSAAATSSSVWGTINSSTLQMGATGTAVNTFWVSTGTQDFVFYCFAEVAGYSAFGSFIGNGNTSGDGPFVHTGFRPALVMMKDAGQGGADAHWIIVDSDRDGYNASNPVLYPNRSNVEFGGAEYAVDLLSNGFKIKANYSAGINGNGNTNIYAAFAESPFQYARAR